MLIRFSPVWLFVTCWTAGPWAPLYMGFFRQVYWSGLPFPSPGESSQPRDWTCQAVCRILQCEYLELGSRVLLSWDVSQYSFLTRLCCQWTKERCWKVPAHFQRAGENCEFGAKRQCTDNWQKFKCHLAAEKVNNCGIFTPWNAIPEWEWMNWYIQHKDYIQQRKKLHIKEHSWFHVYKIQKPDKGVLAVKEGS